MPRRTSAVPLRTPDGPFTEVRDSADNESGAPGRRERKRLETRARLRRAAFDLFSERGFDDVTVTDIADHANVDPSTFFRHFGSKEAVLFSQEQDRDRIVEAWAQRPKGEPTLEAIREAFEGLEPDSEAERLRVKLSMTSPTVRAEMLLRDEEIVHELRNAIARHLDVDPDVDPVPFLTARLWLDAASWYRTRALASTPQGSYVRGRRTGCS